MSDALRTIAAGAQFAYKPGNLSELLERFTAPSRRAKEMMIQAEFQKVKTAGKIGEDIDKLEERKREQEQKLGIQYDSEGNPQITTGAQSKVYSRMTKARNRYLKQNQDAKELDEKEKKKREEAIEARQKEENQAIIDGKASMAFQNETFMQGVRDQYLSGTKSDKEVRDELKKRHTSGESIRQMFLNENADRKTVQTSLENYMITKEKVQYYDPTTVPWALPNTYYIKGTRVKLSDASQAFLDEYELGKSTITTANQYKKLYEKSTDESNTRYTNEKAVQTGTADDGNIDARVKVEFAGDMERALNQDKASLSRHISMTNTLEKLYDEYELYSLGGDDPFERVERKLAKRGVRGPLDTPFLAQDPGFDLDDADDGIVSEMVGDNQIQSTGEDIDGVLSLQEKLADLKGQEAKFEEESTLEGGPSTKRHWDATENEYYNIETETQLNPNELEGVKIELDLTKGDVEPLRQYLDTLVPVGTILKISRDKKYGYQVIGYDDKNQPQLVRVVYRDGKNVLDDSSFNIEGVYTEAGKLYRDAVLESFEAAYENYTTVKLESAEGGSAEAEEEVPAEEGTEETETGKRFRLFNRDNEKSILNFFPNLIQAYRDGTEVAEEIEAEGTEEEVNQEEAAPAEEEEAPEGEATEEEEGTEEEEAPAEEDKNLNLFNDYTTAVYDLKSQIYQFEDDKLKVQGIYRNPSTGKLEAPKSPSEVLNIPTGYSQNIGSVYNKDNISSIKEMSLGDKKYVNFMYTSMRIRAKAERGKDFQYQDAKGNKFTIKANGKIIYKNKTYDPQKDLSYLNVIKNLHDSGKPL